MFGVLGFALYIICMNYKKGKQTIKLACIEVTGGKKFLNQILFSQLCL